MTTTNLFWKKFPYKVVISSPWAGSVRYTNYKTLDKIADGDINKNNSYFYNKTTIQYHKELRSALEFIDRYDSDDLRFRCEGLTLSLFFKDRSMLNDIKKEFDPHVDVFYEPINNDALQQMLDQKILVKERLIHDCRYKVMLRDRMDLLTDASKKNLSRLLTNNEDRYANTRRLIQDLDNDRKYIWQSYIYAKDGKDLVLLQMMANSIIREVVKIVTYAELKEDSTANEQ